MIDDLKKHEANMLREIDELADPMAVESMQHRLRGFQSAILIAKTTPKRTTFSAASVFVTALMFFGIGWMCCGAMAPMKVNHGVSSEMEAQLGIMLKSAATGNVHKLADKNAGLLPVYNCLKLASTKLRNPGKPYLEQHRNVLDTMGPTGKRIADLDRKEFGE